MYVLFVLHVGGSENRGYLILGVLLIRILLFRVLYKGPLFSETPMSHLGLMIHEMRHRTEAEGHRDLRLLHCDAGP